MNSSANLIRVIAVICLLATPAVTLRVVSTYFDAPHLQPLALTKESVAAQEKGKAGSNGANGKGLARIAVHVDWGRDWTGAMTQAGLRDVITATLAHQTEFFHFDFKDLPGEDIDVTFIVGPNSYGPFPPGQMAAGVKSALIALRMTNGPERF